MMQRIRVLLSPRLTFGTVRSYAWRERPARASLSHLGQFQAELEEKVHVKKFDHIEPFLLGALRNVVPRDHALYFKQCITVLTRHKQLDLCLRLVQLAERRKVGLNSRMLRAEAFAACGDVVHLKDLLSKQPNDPDLHVALLKAYRTNSNLSAMMEHVASLHIPVTLDMYKALLSATAVSGDGQRAQQIAATLQQQGLPFDTDTWLWLIRSYSGAAMSKEMTAAMDSALKAGLHVNSVIRSTLVRCYARTGEIDMIHKWTEGLDDFYVKQRLIEARCYHVKNLQEAITMLKENPYVYTLQALANRLSLEDGMPFLREAQRLGVVPSTFPQMLIDVHVHSECSMRPLLLNHLSDMQSFPVQRDLRVIAGTGVSRTGVRYSALRSAAVVFMSAIVGDRHVVIDAANEDAIVVSKEGLRPALQRWPAVLSQLQLTDAKTRVLTRDVRRDE